MTTKYQKAKHHARNMQLSQRQMRTRMREMEKEISELRAKAAEPSFCAGCGDRFGLLTAPPVQAVSVPFDIEEYLSAYEWRAEDGGLSELTTRDRQLLQDFANGLPLYTALPARVVSVPEDEELALDLLCLMYDAWENGVGCYENPEDCSGYVGTAFKLESSDEEKIIGLLNRKRPQLAAAPSPTGLDNPEPPKS